MTAPTFVHTGHPTRVVFGAGTLHTVPAEVDGLGLGCVLVVSTPGRADLAQRVNRGLGEIGAGVYAHAEQHVPVDRAEQAVQHARALGIDGVVAIGGGSTVGLAKAIALREPVSILAVPTTYAGSELTPVWGLTDIAGKRTGRDPQVLPATVVYDPELTVSLPPRVSGASGLNAVAHAVEAFYAPDGSPLVRIYAEESLRALTAALPAIAADPEDRGARAQALYGAWLAGSCLGLTSMGLHHKLCHVLGGRFGMPHAETHAVVLPYVLAFQAPAVPETTAALSRAFQRDDVPQALHDLAAALNVPGSLAELGLERDALDEVAATVLEAPQPGPRELTADALTALLHSAWSGATPTAA